MARSRARVIEIDDDGSDHPMLGRFLLWAGLAAMAVGLAVLAAQTQTGRQRLAALMGQGGAATGAARSGALVAPPRPSEADIESRRLAEQVRLLAADRDRLLARVDALERNVESTGSLPRDTPPAQPSAPPSAPPSLPPGWSLFPNNIPLAAGVPATPVPNAGAATAPAIGAPTHPAAPAQSGTTPGGGGLVANEQAAASVATRTEFAVDIGGDATFEGLRALWASLKGSHGALFEGLRPVVAVREGAKAGALELRLVVGPLGNAGAAARLCASLGAAGVACQPTIFDGQRFALR